MQLVKEFIQYLNKKKVDYCHYLCSKSYERSICLYRQQRRTKEMYEIPNWMHEPWVENFNKVLKIMNGYTNMC